MSRTVFLTSRRKGSGQREDSESSAAEEAARVRSYPTAVPDEAAENALARLRNPALDAGALEGAAEELRVASVVSGRL